MKIDIITIHCQTNFGSAFQCFALHRFLTLQHYDTRVIDYRPSYIEDGFGKGLKGTVKRLLFSGSIKQGKKKYNDFIARHVSLTPKTYYSYQALEDDYAPRDLLIAGSDQLWNTRYACGRDDSYRLTFTNVPRKLSYATSLNGTTISDADIAHLAEQTADFEALSVRERSSAEILSRKMGREVQLVCDPVFLLEQQEYRQMCEKVTYGDYILVYLAEAGELLDKAVAFAKSKLGCKVISVCGVRPHCKCDIHLKNPGPEEMLSLINGAKMIVTGSFHATSFSHILHKDFIVLPPKENAERISSLVSISGLATQVCRSEEDLERTQFGIDFTESDASLTKLREASKEWLLRHIENQAKP